MNRWWWHTICECIIADGLTKTLQTTSAPSYSWALTCPFTKLSLPRSSPRSSFSGLPESVFWTYLPKSAAAGRSGKSFSGMTRYPSALLAKLGLWTLRLCLISSAVGKKWNECQLTAVDSRKSLRLAAWNTGRRRGRQAQMMPTLISTLDHMMGSTVLPAKV